MQRNFLVQYADTKRPPAAHNNRSWKLWLGPVSSLAEANTWAQDALNDHPHARVVECFTPISREG